MPDQGSAARGYAFVRFRLLVCPQNEDYGSWSYSVSCATLSSQTQDLSFSLIHNIIRQFFCYRNQVMACFRCYLRESDLVIIVLVVFHPLEGAFLISNKNQKHNQERYSPQKKRHHILQLYLNHDNTIM